jgi:hypothetical protein
MVSEYTRLFVKIVRLRKFCYWGQAMWGLYAAAKTWLFQCCHVSAQTIKVNIGGELAWRCVQRQSKKVTKEWTPN